MPSGADLGELTREFPEGLAADLAECRVVSVEGTVRLEPVPVVTPPTQRWVVRLDDGEALALAPEVCLPPGRQRLYFLPRSRLVVGGEPRPEQWGEYRSLVLRAQHLETADVGALRAGRLPPGFAARRFPVVWWWWLLALLWLPWALGLGLAGVSPTWDSVVFTVALCGAGLWGAHRLLRVHRDVGRGAVTFVDGPVHVRVVIGRYHLHYELVVGGARFRLPRSDMELVPTLQTCTPSRVYQTPTSKLFVAIDPHPESA